MPLPYYRWSAFIACAFFNLVIQIRKKKKDYLTKRDTGQNLQSSVVKFYSEIII